MIFSGEQFGNIKKLANLNPANPIPILQTQSKEIDKDVFTKVLLFPIFDSSLKL